VRSRWRTLLRQQHVQGREQHLQELALHGVRYAGHLLVDCNSVLRGQHLHGRLLYHPLQHVLVG
jgi:hypothetical protein